MFRKSDEVTVGRIDRAAKCLEAAAGSFAHNLQQESTGSSYFERMVISNHPLSPAHLDDFARVAEARGHEYVSELDTWLSKHTQPDRSPGGKRYGVGVYFFEEAQVEQQIETDASEGAGLASSGMAGKQEPAVEIDVLAPISSLKLETKNPGE